MIFRHRKYGTGLQVSREEYAASPRPRSSKAIFRALMAIAIPVALGSLATQVTNLIDAVSLQWCLKTVISESGDVVRGMYEGLFDSGLQADQFQSWLVGMRGTALTYVNLVPNFTLTFGISSCRSSRRPGCQGPPPAEKHGGIGAAYHAAHRPAERGWG